MEPTGQKKGLEATSNGIKGGDWVRVLKNTVSAPSPYKDSTQLAPYDAVQVSKVAMKPMGSSMAEMVYYVLPGRSSHYYLVAREVEKIDECICAAPLRRACGCKCGWQTMKDAAPK